MVRKWCSVTWRSFHDGSASVSARPVPAWHGDCAKKPGASELRNVKETACFISDGSSARAIRRITGIRAWGGTIGSDWMNPDLRMDPARGLELARFDCVTLFDVPTSAVNPELVGERPA